MVSPDSEAFPARLTHFVDTTSTVRTHCFLEPAVRPQRDAERFGQHYCHAVCASRVRIGVASSSEDANKLGCSGSPNTCA
jgi:hypothetical protein